MAKINISSDIYNHVVQYVDDLHSKGLIDCNVRHAVRICNQAVSIAKSLNCDVDLEKVNLVALLHMCNDEQIEDCLKDVHLTNTYIKDICRMVNSLNDHSKSLVIQCVQDAITLEALNTQSKPMAFSSGGNVVNAVNDEMRQFYQKEQQAVTELNTDKAKELGEKRQKDMLRFIRYYDSNIVAEQSQKTAIKMSVASAGKLGLIMSGSLAENTNLAYGRF